MTQIRKLKGSCSFQQNKLKINEIIEWTRHIDERFEKIELDIIKCKHELGLR